MTVLRLRPAHPPERLAEIYKRPHDHTLWADHRDRVNATIALALPFAPFDSAADLSCGDATIIDTLGVDGPRYYGDVAPGYPICGPIEETIEAIPKVDLFVLTETLEHLDDPAAVLCAVNRKTTGVLVLSTPVGAWNDANEEHYWAWSKAGVEELLGVAGFHPQAYEELDFSAHGAEFYTFGIWVCS